MHGGTCDLGFCSDIEGGPKTHTQRRRVGASDIGDEYVAADDDQYGFEGIRS
jgi:hypothetical protein